MKNLFDVIKRPIITEKGLSVKDTQQTLVFEVARQASKVEIREAVQTLFQVKVESIRTALQQGKERRRGRFSGYRPDWKKAYVKLRAGEKIPEFAETV